MSMMHRLITMLAVAVFAIPATAQDDVTVSAFVRDRSVYLGDSIEVQVHVENATDEVGEPRLTVPGMRVQSLGSQRRRSTTVVNGVVRRSDAQIFTLLVYPDTTGVVTIPPIEVVVDGETFETEPIRVQVIEPQTDQAFELDLIPETTEPYVQQRVGVRAVLYLPNETIQNVEFLGDWNADAFGLFLLPAEGAMRDQQIAFLDKAANFSLIEVERDGQLVRALQIDMVVIPKKAGTLSTGPLVATIDTRRRNDTRFRRVAARSPILSFDVKELPTEGRPPHFSGLVGEYELTASARPTNVNVGDPIDLSVLVEGTTPIASVDAPDLSLQPGFDELFKPSPQGWQDVQTRAVDVKAFRTVVRATSEQVSEIPPIELPYFDPELGEYRVAKSDPIALSVRATREVTLADAEGAPLSPSVATEPLESTGPSIPSNDDSLSALEREGFDLVGLATSPVGIAIIGGPPALTLAAGVFVLAVRRHDPRARRRARASGRARRALRRSSDPSTIERAIRGYVADVEGCEPVSVTPEDCRQLAHEAGLEDDRVLARLLDECVAPRFGGEESGAQSIASDAISAIDRIDRGLDR